MNILNELEYQLKKIKHKWLFFHFFLKKITTTKKPVSKTILIIRIDAIGDCIIWLDQAKEYRKIFPDHKFILLHNKAWSEIAERLPWFDECVPFDRTKIGNIKYYKTLITTLNKYTYEKVFSPVFSRDFITVDWLVHNINAIEKIGYDGDYHNNYLAYVCDPYYSQHSNEYNLKAIADSWYTTLVSNIQDCTMELQRNAQFIRQTINSGFRCRLPKIPFDIPIYDQLKSKEYAVVFPGASVEYRMWPINYFLKTVNYIPYPTIVLCGSQQEKKLAEEFIFAYKGDKNIINLVGATNLLELISVISNAKIVISNETSASHISVATRTPSICLLGGGHYGRFHPYKADIIDDDDTKALPIVVNTHDMNCFNCNWICKHPLQNGRWKCIDEITTEKVIEVLKKSNIQSKV